ncbi:unnamed protein product, partial [Adineta steineri]
MAEEITVPSVSTPHFRFFDLMHETDDKLPLINDYQQPKQRSLEEAIAYIQQHKTLHIDADIQNKVSLARKKCSEEDDINNLTVDESAAIQLYTMESETERESFFYILNSLLRLPDRNELEPVLSYFKLLIGALEKLPTLNGLIYRGVNGNISSNFVKGKKLTWWGFSSCTQSLEVLQKEEFLGKSGQRTLFYIECINGKSIENYSYSSSDEKEVLLLPGTEFLITGKKRANRDLTIVHLKEIRADDPASYVTKTIEKICGHGCNLWKTRQCCHCSGMYL